MLFEYIFFFFTVTESGNEMTNGIWKKDSKNYKGLELIIYLLLEL